MRRPDSEMPEIGGYIELERNHGRALHEELTAVNCGRNALAYLIEVRGIKSIALPYYICGSVTALCEKYGLRVRSYRLRDDFRPDMDGLSDDEWLYVVDPYGQLTEDDIKEIKAAHGKTILDNAQAYFKEPVPGVDTVYTARKFFGVPDGGFVATEAKLGRELETDVSGGRMSFLIGRFEGRASDYYDEYAANNKSFANEPLKAMSSLTMNLLKGIDYDFVRARREENFDRLHLALGGSNELRIRRPEGPFAYPYMVRGAAEIRRKMIERKIYIPILWPDAASAAPEGSFDRRLSADVLPLPVDQRYGAEEMDIMIDALKEFGAL